MSNISDFMPRGKPKRIVELTSGTGTFTPLEANSWCRVTMQAPGGGGDAGRAGANIMAGSGGGAGSTWTFWVRVSGATAYAVGAGGSGANAGNSYTPSNGGLTSFGSARLAGGSYSGSGYSGAPRHPTVNIGSNMNVPVNGVIPGGLGGGTSSDGGVSFIVYPHNCGFPPGNVPAIPAFNTIPETQAVQGGTTSGGSHYGGGGGGSSMYGPGGAGGNGNSAGAGVAGANATGYGGGGGGGGNGASGRASGGNGSGGLIIIEEFGA